MNLPSLDSYARLFDFIDSHEAGQAKFLGEWLYSTLKPSRVIDWGCATGLYLLPFKAWGCDVMGIDTDPWAGHSLAENEFRNWDLRLPNGLKGLYDLALCIETAEHIQAEYADQVVKNVANNTFAIFWSAAHPGQGGLYHYNEQPKSYWYEKFQTWGFDLHPLHAELMSAIAANPECQRVEWLIPNSMLLIHT